MSLRHVTLFPLAEKGFRVLINYDDFKWFCINNYTV